MRMIRLAAFAALGALFACSEGANEERDAAPDAVADGSEPACGDGTVDEGEDCDDGNLVDGDGCSGSCALEDVCVVSVAEGGGGQARTVLVRRDGTVDIASPLPTLEMTTGGARLPAIHDAVTRCGERAVCAVQGRVNTTEQSLFGAKVALDGTLEALTPAPLANGSALSARSVAYLPHLDVVVVAAASNAMSSRPEVALEAFRVGADAITRLDDTVITLGEENAYTSATGPGSVHLLARPGTDEVWVATYYEFVSEFVPETVGQMARVAVGADGSFDVIEPVGGLYPPRFGGGRAAPRGFAFSADGSTLLASGYVDVTCASGTAIWSITGTVPPDAPPEVICGVDDETNQRPRFSGVQPNRYFSSSVHASSGAVRAFVLGEDGASQVTQFSATVPGGSPFFEPVFDDAVIVSIASSNGVVTLVDGTTGGLDETELTVPFDGLRGTAALHCSVP